MRTRTRVVGEGVVVKVRTVIGPCGKRTYSRRKEAAEVAARMRREEGENVEHYHHAPCHGWHVGHRAGEPRTFGGSAT